MPWSKSTSQPAPTWDKKWHEIWKNRGFSYSKNMAGGFWWNILSNINLLFLKSVYDKQIYLFFLVVGWILKFWSCWGCNFNSSPNWPRCENSTANQCVEAIWNFPRFRGGFSCKWKFPGKWCHFSMFFV